MLGIGLESATISTGISDRDSRLHNEQAGLHTSFPMGHASGAFCGTVDPEMQYANAVSGLMGHPVRFGSVGFSNGESWFLGLCI